MPPLSFQNCPIPGQSRCRDTSESCPLLCLRHCCSLCLSLAPCLSLALSPALFLSLYLASFLFICLSLLTCLRDLLFCVFVLVLDIAVSIILIIFVSLSLSRSLFLYFSLFVSPCCIFFSFRFTLMSSCFSLLQYHYFYLSRSFRHFFFVKSTLATKFLRVDPSNVRRVFAI